MTLIKILHFIILLNIIVHRGQDITKCCLHLMLTLQGKNDLWFLQKQWAAEITNLQRIIEGNKMAKINIEKRIVVQLFLQIPVL